MLTTESVISFGFAYGIYWFGQNPPITDEQDDVCDTCPHGKQNRSLFPNSNLTRATERLQLIHSDVGGLYGAVMVDFKNHMKSQFKMSDLGLMSHFLGLEIQLKKDSKSIHRTKYAKDFLKRFQMQACKPVATPITFGCKLLKEDGGAKRDVTTYKSKIGGLQHLSSTRPDLMFATI
ncbi:NBS type disease resistance-like protein [Theobroma cacao]|uniref:NBS type disease resistance-like protein n=1 Tax=Theobroma cacao TaxID=3641 RepID=A0A061EKY5_THECC|nr:NBS type disease resistance-like protein [Theobroma cacao]